MRRKLRWIGIAVVLVLLGGGGYMLAKIGPRNAWGMLRYDQRREGDLQVGQRAPDLTLTALDGRPLRLSERMGAKPLVLIFGSYT